MQSVFGRTPSYLKIEQWSPFESWKNFKYKLNVILNNLISILYIIESFSIFSIIIITACILFTIKFPSGRLETVMPYLIIIIVLYSVGYSLILVEERYLWIVSILLLLMGAYLLNTLSKKNRITTMMKNLLLILLVFSFIIMPITDMNKDLTIYEDFYSVSKSLDNTYHIHGNIASNSEWEGTVYIAYYLKSRYYGILKENSPSLEKELKDNEIDYYFVWNDNKPLNLFNYTEIIRGKNFRIYSKVR